MIDFHLFSAKAFILLPLSPLAEASGNLKIKSDKRSDRTFIDFPRIKRLIFVHKDLPFWQHEFQPK